jgi:hypothetical protein
VIPEPYRLQYLEAMGLTAWVARYALSNARPTPACEWTPPDPEAATRPHGERLHALLDEAAERQQAMPRQAPAEPAPRQASAPAPGKARSLLGEAPVEASPSTAPAPEAPSADPGEALRFTLQVACLEGRWLLLVPQQAALDATRRHLLDNLLAAAGVTPETAPAFETFRWPPMEGPAMAEPEDEAREGLQAFLAGRRQRGWAPERVLVFGRAPALDRVLALEEGHCPPLDLPAWQGPGLAELAGSAAAKRALLPMLASWRRAWRPATPSGAIGDAETPDA